MDNELRDLEDQLGKLSPVAMPEDMLARMEQAMHNWREHTPAEEKIVPFQSPPEQTSSRFHIWASAAAVALIGAVSTVLLVPDDAGSGSVVAGTEAPVNPPTATALPLSKPSSNLVDVSNSKFDSQIQGKPSYSIRYDAEGRPHKLVEVRFVDEITLHDDKGRPVKIKKPRTEYYLVPVEVQ